MEAEKFKKAQEIEREISELNQFRILLDSYFSGKEIRATINIKYDGDELTIPKTNMDKKTPNDGICSQHKDRFFVLIAQLIREKENEFKSL